MTKAREYDLIPWNWIVDRSRPGYKPAMWENPKEFIESVKESYRKDYWDNQSLCVEIWTEKDAIIGTVMGILPHRLVSCDGEDLQSRQQQHRCWRRV